jgi:hypothetical protein
MHECSAIQAKKNQTLIVPCLKCGNGPCAIVDDTSAVALLGPVISRLNTVSEIIRDLMARDGYYPSRYTVAGISMLIDDAACKAREAQERAF